MSRPAVPKVAALSMVRDLRAALRLGVDAEQIARERAEVERKARARETGEEAAREARREQGRRARVVDYSAAAIPPERSVPGVPDVAPLVSSVACSLVHAGEVLQAGDLSALHTVVSELRERERDARAFVDAWPVGLPWSTLGGGVHRVYATAQDAGAIAGMVAYYLAAMARRV